MREVVTFARKIQGSKVDHYDFLAKLQGHTLETNFQSEPSTSLTVEQETKIESYLKRKNEEMRRNHGQK